MAFDLGEFLKDVPDLGTGREQIEYLPLCALGEDPNNFYQLSGLDALADNIATCGLQQPIRVRPDPAEPGRYIIVSGHRRRAALDMLAQEEPEKWADVPCIVEKGHLSPELQQLRLIYANANTRAMTAAELSQQAVQVEKLLYQLKEQGFEFPGRMRDHVAQAVGASKSKLSRLKVIREHLTQPWQEHFQSGKLVESTAYALAQMPQEHQGRLYEAFGNAPKTLYEATVKAADERLKKLSGATCPKDPALRCDANEARVRKVAKLASWENGCKGCCCDCGELVSCTASCPAAAQIKAARKQEQKQALADRKAEEAAKAQPHIDFVRGIYARIGQARARAGLDMESYLKTHTPYVLQSDVKQFSKAENDPTTIHEGTKLPFGRNLWCDQAEMLCKVADALHVSLDWIFGRELRETGEADAPQTDGAKAGWQTGTPETPGIYAVLTRGRYDDDFFVDDRKWDGSEWVVSPYDDAPVAYWMPLPEHEDV